MIPVLAPCKAAVIITSTHAQTLSCVVKRHQWNHNQIQRPGLDQGRWQPFRFEYVVAVGSQGIAWLPGCKPQAPVSNRVQYRQVALLAHGTGLLQHRQGIQLTINSQIQRNVFGRSKSSQRHKPPACSMRSSSTTGSTQLLAPCAHSVSGIKGIVHEIGEGKASSACAAAGL